MKKQAKSALSALDALLASLKDKLDESSERPVPEGFEKVAKTLFEASEGHNTKRNKLLQTIADRHGEVLAAAVGEYVSSETTKLKIAMLCRKVGAPVCMIELVLQEDDRFISALSLLHVGFQGENDPDKARKLGDATYVRLDIMPIVKSLMTNEVEFLRASDGLAEEVAKFFNDGDGDGDGGPDDEDGPKDGDDAPKAKRERERETH